MWAYNTSIDSKMHYFPTQEDTIFAIMCVMRYEAVIKEVSDYYIYNDETLVEILEGDYLYQLYIENGGVVL